MGVGPASATRNQPKTSTSGAHRRSAKTTHGATNWVTFCASPWHGVQTSRPTWGPKRQRPEAQYRSASSSWLQRKYGNYDAQSAFGGDWLPITDWLERFLSALLWWPGRRIDKHTRTVDRGIEATRDLVEDRIQYLQKEVGKATTVQFLPMAFSSLVSLERPQEPPRLCRADHISPRRPFPRRSDPSVQPRPAPATGAT